MYFDPDHGLPFLQCGFQVRVCFSPALFVPLGFPPATAALHTEAFTP